MPGPNFLLGKGERLTEDVVVPSGGGPKQAPYSTSEARARLAPMVRSASNAVDNLRADACPDDKAVVSVTLNPEYISKSYFPDRLLTNVGVEVIGSRPRRMTPEKRSRNREPEEAVTTELFAVGSRAAIRRWGSRLEDGDLGVPEELVSIEEVSAPTPASKIKGPVDDSTRVLEVVLHANELESMWALGHLESFLAGREIPAELGRRFFAKGLCFLEVATQGERASEIAEFSIVRAVRGMPTLRTVRPFVRVAGVPGGAIEMPEASPVSEEVRVAVFDGGFPRDSPLAPWVRPFDAPGVGKPSPELVNHGHQVTSAVLFGHVNPKAGVERPFAFVDNYRVLDDSPSNGHELYEVLERIEAVLGSNHYDVINLSLGPHLPIEDDEVHAWTAVLDDRLSRANTTLTVAVGNDGEGDAEAGLNRIQVPSDCVNAIAVGAADAHGETWQRASYSCVGPGRSPGRVKPDVMSFGGTVAEPFLVITDSAVSPRLSGTGGTSLASPAVARLGAGVRAHFGSSLNHLAIRALLVHTADAGEHDLTEVGWGRVPTALSDIVTCSDHEIRVVYQGEITPTKYIRANIPVPDGTIDGMVEISATICFKSQVDPHHPGNYTQSGFEVAFRPHDEKFASDTSEQPKTATFFRASSVYAPEEVRRRDAGKWENCLHAKKRMRGSSLKHPVFDIHYIARLESGVSKTTTPIEYALVVTLSAPRMEDLYDQIVRKYVAVIEPIRPRVEVPVRT